MNPLLRIAAIASLATLAGCAATAALPTSGRVVDVDSGAPVAGAMVLSYVDVPQVIHGHRCAQVELAVSGADGSFSMKGAPLNEVGLGSGEHYFKVYKKEHKFAVSHGSRISMKHETDRQARLAELRRLGGGLTCSGWPSEAVAEVHEAMAAEGAELAQTPQEIESYVTFPKMRAASQREAAASFKASKANK